MNRSRRNMLYGGVAAAAGLAGAGAAWWKFQPHDVPGVTATQATEDFWGLSFYTPNGQSFAMNSFRGKVLLVNFWATWCPPCVEELPLLDFFYQENKGKNVQVVGLAVDQPSAVRTWLQTRPLNFPVGMAGLNGTNLSKSLGNQAGGLPFTLLFNPAGQLLQRKIGKVTPEELVAWTRPS